MRFAIGQNIFNHSSPDPGDARLCVWFEDANLSGIACWKANTPELNALYRVLNQLFPGKNLVAQNGSESVLIPNVPYEFQLQLEAAARLKPFVIEALEQIGHTYDPTTPHVLKCQDHPFLSTAADSKLTTH